MKLLRTCLVLAALVSAFAGCGKKEIPAIDRKKAAALVSEGEFAASVRDYARAEGLFVEAASLCPDTGPYWLSLGSMRMRLGKRDAARDAYKRALGIFERVEKTKGSEAEGGLQQVYVLALLGRVEEARSLQEKLLKRYPTERPIRVFVEEKRLDRILADPTFKQFAL